MDENESRDPKRRGKEERFWEDNGAAPEDDPMPKRKKFAVARCCIALALTAAILLATNFGAFHLMFGGADLTEANLAPNKYLTFNVDTVIDYLSEEYKSGAASATDASATDTSSAAARWVIIPCQGQLAIIRLPQRYLEDGDTIAVQTYYQLYSGTAADKYFIVSGAVKKVPDDIAAKYADWYNQNALYMYQYGFIDKVDQTAITYYVDVDSTGIFGDTACTVVSCVGAALLLYAIAELVLILRHHYDGEKDIAVEIYEDMSGSGPEPSETEEPENAEGPSEPAEPEDAEKPEEPGKPEDADEP